MVKQFFALSCLSLTFLAFSPLAHASVIIWDNGTPSVTTPGATALTDFQTAQDFVLGSTTSLTDVRFWNLETAGHYAGSISWEIVTNNLGAPGASVLAFGSATPTRTAAGTVLGYDQYQNDFSITVANLVAGTYWLTLHNGAISNVGPNTDYFWSWADLNGVNTPSFRGYDSDLVGGGGYLINGQEHAFYLAGNVVPSGVPEPATMAFAGAGLAALAVLRVRKCRS